jgi:hypothetical protein
MKNMKGVQYGLVAALALIAGLGGGLALGQHEGDAITKMETTDSPEKGEGKPLAPPSILDGRTLYADEKNVTTQHVVRAGRFELADQKGNTRAVLGLNPEGEPRLAMADESGQILATLGLELDYKFNKSKLPTLRFLDRGGKVRSEINLTRTGDPVIILRNERGGVIASLTGTDKNGTELILMDEKGLPRIVQNINRNGTNVSFFDEAGKVRAGLGLKNNGDPSLVFLDEKMKNRVKLGYVDSMITDKKSKETKTISSLALFDKDGKVLWKAP